MKKLTVWRCSRINWWHNLCWWLSQCHQRSIGLKSLCCRFFLQISVTCLHRINVTMCWSVTSYPLIQKYFCTWRKFWSSNPYSSFELRCWFCFSWICSISFKCRCFVNFLVDLHLFVIHFRFINSVNLEFFCNFYQPIRSISHWSNFTFLSSISKSRNSFEMIIPRFSI